MKAKIISKVSGKLGLFLKPFWWKNEKKNVAKSGFEQKRHFYGNIKIKFLSNILHDFHILPLKVSQNFVACLVFL